MDVDENEGSTTRLFFTPQGTKVAELIFFRHLNTWVDRQN